MNDTAPISALPYTEFPFTMDAGIDARAAIGIVVLATDHTVEHEWRHLLNQPGVAFFESRLHNSADIAPATLASMERDIPAAVRLILPEVVLQVVAFGCTSGTMVIGESNVFKRIHEARPGVACTTPLTAAMAALDALQMRRIALLTPYIPEINRLFVDFIGAAGIHVSRVGSFNHANDNEVARIDRVSLRHAILSLGRHHDVDAVFVSCTSLRLAEFIPQIEAELCKPVISSNYAMAWHALRLAGVTDQQPQHGILFSR